MFPIVIISRLQHEVILPSGSKIRAVHGELHVGVDVDPAGDDVAARRVDDGVGDDAELGCLAGGEQGSDRLPVDEHVALAATGRRHDRPPGDEQLRHRPDTTAAGRAATADARLTR